MPHAGETQSGLSTAPAVQAVTPGASPYTFTAPDPGKLVVQGGTVSLIELGRGSTFITTGLTGCVLPVARGDLVRITYVVAPTLNFFRL